MSNPAFKFDHVHIISKDPEGSANWYVEMFGARIAANTMARGAPQIFVELGGMTDRRRHPASKFFRSAPAEIAPSWLPVDRIQLDVWQLQ
jgi:catechol 2,3-dioxygenase-like lactoylglutathione lyase family enzyme